MIRPREEIVKIAPVWPVQYCVVPAVSVDGPVAQFEVPTGPPVPASVTTRPAPSDWLSSDSGDSQITRIR